MSLFLRRCALFLLAGLLTTPITAQGEARVLVEAGAERSFLGERLQEPHDEVGLALAVPVRIEDQGDDEKGKTVEDTTQDDGVEAFDGSVLGPATLRYKTDVGMGQQSTMRPTIRTLSAETHNGVPIWRVIDAVEQATQADTLFLDRQSLRPRQRRVGGRFALTLTFDSTSVTGTLRAGGQTKPIENTFGEPVLASTANMEVGLATLPLDPGYTAEVPVFHLQQQNVTPTTLRVTGTETATVPAGSFETYVVKTTSQGPGPSGTYYVRTSAPHHVVKADLEVTGPSGRTVTATKQLTSIQEGSGER